MPVEKPTIKFYTTSACHLCEKAIQLLSSMPEVTEITVIVSDISHSAELMERYGTRIPVIAAGEGQRELSWPFDARDVKQYLHITGLINKSGSFSG